MSIDITDDELTRVAAERGVRIAERIPVAFAGDGSGEEDLSWGQRDIWMAMVRQNNWLPMGGWRRLPEGTVLADMTGELGYMHGRFPSMRTRLVFGPGGEPRQVLSSDGETVLHVIDGDGTDADLDVLAEKVKDWYQDTPYDFAAQWPVRMAVIRSGGRLTHQISIMCHLVADGLGALAMLRDMENRPDGTAGGIQPLEQARWQRSPAGQRQNAAALRHWETMLRAAPQRPFPVLGGRREPRHWRGEFASRALRAATHALTARTGADSSQVMLTLFALAMTATTGASPPVIRPMVGNRFRPGLADVVCMAAQYGVCAPDVAGLPFDEALARVARASMTAHKHAYYDPESVAGLVARIQAERGEGFELGAQFNDRRLSTRSGFTGAAPAPDEIAVLAGTGVMTWTTRQDDPFERLIVHVDDVRTADGHSAFGCLVFMDTDAMPPSAVEELLRRMEDIAVTAAVAGAAPISGGTP